MKVYKICGTKENILNRKQLSKNFINQIGRKIDRLKKEIMFIFKYDADKKQASEFGKKLKRIKRKFKKCQKKENI